jgi:hypothetical protein
MLVTLNANREAYSPAEIANKTMTVAELIDFLTYEFGPESEAPVLLSHDGGYTYGSISESDFAVDHEALEVDE